MSSRSPNFGFYPQLDLVADLAVREALRAIALDVTTLKRGASVLIAGDRLDYASLDYARIRKELQEGGIAPITLQGLAGTPLEVAVVANRSIFTTPPLTGGGDLSSNLTLGITDFVASGAAAARGAVPTPPSVAGVRRFLREDVGWAVPRVPLESPGWYDDFMGASTESGEIGELGWELAAGGYSVGAGTATAAHPGFGTLASTIVTGTIGRLLLLDLIQTDAAYLAAVVRPVSGTTVMSFRFGLLRSPSTSGEGSRGAYWSFDATTSANWRTVTRGSLGITANTTSVAYATGNWFLLEILRSGNDWAFYLNGVLRFTHTTNLDPGFAQPCFAIETGEAADKTIDVDAFAMRAIDPLGQRWT